MLYTDSEIMEKTTTTTVTTTTKEKIKGVFKRSKIYLKKHKGTNDGGRRKLVPALAYDSAHSAFYYLFLIFCNRLHEGGKGKRNRFKTDGHFYLKVKEWKKVNEICNSRLFREVEGKYMMK